MAEVGRPKAERASRGVRIYEDTADMLGWILKLEDNGETAADFVEDLIRREVENRYAPLAKRVERIKAAMAGDEADQTDPAFANELQSEG